MLYPNESVFILKSDSGETGIVPMDIRINLFGIAITTNKINTDADIQFRGHVGYFYHIIPIFYPYVEWNNFGEIDFQNESIYSKFVSDMDFFEIGKPYIISRFSIYTPPPMPISEPYYPIDFNSFAYAQIDNYAYADLRVLS